MFTSLCHKFCKPASVPSGERASAITAHASLPERTIIPLIKSKTVTRSVDLETLLIQYIELHFELVIFHYCETTRFINSNVTYKVISFDIDVGIGKSAFFDKRTVPVVSSIT